jgi:hypothetical protein
MAAIIGLTLLALTGCENPANGTETPKTGAFLEARRFSNPAPYSPIPGKNRTPVLFTHSSYSFLFYFYNTPCLKITGTAKCPFTFLLVSAICKSSIDFAPGG